MNSLNIFDLLKKYSKKERNIYLNIDDEFKNQFSPYLIMKYLSGTNSNQQLILINEICNRYIFKLSAHKHLISELLTVSTDGYNHRYTFIKEKKKDNEYALSAEIIRLYFECSKNEVNDFLIILTKHDIMTIAEELGKDDTFIKKLMTELKNHE